MTPLPGAVAITAAVRRTACTARIWTTTRTPRRSRRAPINISDVTDPAPQQVYQSVRFDPGLTYTIPNLNPGLFYNVRLDFAEIYFGEARQRVFNVIINGVQVLTGFDIFATAGGENVIAENFTTMANPAGQIVIVFAQVTNNPMVNGIQVTPTPLLIAIDSGGPGSGYYVADTDYSGAQTTYTSSAINTSEVTSPARTGLSNRPLRDVFPLHHPQPDAGGDLHRPPRLCGDLLHRRGQARYSTFPSTEHRS